MRDGKLVMRKNGDTEMHVFLFDHAFLIAKKKENSFKIARRPIPIELVTIVQEKPTGTPSGPQDPNRAFPITFSVPSRYGGIFSLFALTHADRVTWIDAIEKQKSYNVLHKRKFKITTLTSNMFPLSNSVNCSTIYQKQLIVGTDFGLFVGNSGEDTEGEMYMKFSKVLDLERIHQVDVLPKIDLILVLAGIARS